jgi:hypothetical protein
MVAKRVVVCLVMAGAIVHAQSADPGVRQGSPAAGSALSGISSLQQHLFDFVTGEFAQGLIAKRWG